MELINRRSAITALAKQMSDCTPYRNEIVKQCIGAVQKLKVHDPKKRKTGKWIITARNGVLCSECKSGTRKMPMLLGNPLYKFCPFCGAKIEGVEE